MKTIEEKITPTIFPTDIKGVRVNIGDKVRGFGYISFQDGWANRQDTHCYRKHSGRTPYVWEFIM